MLLGIPLRPIPRSILVLCKHPSHAISSFLDKEVRFMYVSRHDAEWIEITTVTVPSGVSNSIASYRLWVNASAVSRHLVPLTSQNKLESFIVRR